MGAFTTNAVAERAGVSIGSLYQYFPSKAAILGALILRETSALIADAGASLAASTGSTAISLFIRSAVAHQLRRPALARLLDLEEARLPADPDTQHVTRRLHALLMEILDRADLPRQDNRDTAAHDLFAIVKAMVDAAGQRGETDPVALSSRVGRAVHGYLHPPA